MKQDAWQEAFKKAVRVYFEEGDEDLSINKVKERKYTKKYLDDFEQERLGMKKTKDTAIANPE